MIFGMLHPTLLHQLEKVQVFLNPRQAPERTQSRGAGCKTSVRSPHILTCLGSQPDRVGPSLLRPGRKHGGHSRHQAVRQVELRRCGGAAAPHAKICMGGPGPAPRLTWRVIRAMTGQRHLPGGLHRGEAQVCRVRPPHRWALPEEALPQGAVPHRGEVRRQQQQRRLGSFWERRCGSRQGGGRQRCVRCAGLHATAGAAFGALELLRLP